MSRFSEDTASDEEIAEETALYEPLTEAVRGLVDATIRTTTDPDDVRSATEQINAITEQLRAEQIDGSYGVKFRKDGRGRPWGNAVIGLRNPIAPPLTITTDSGGKAFSDFHLGAAYEGPPGLVHGGVVSLVLDQLLGQAAGAGGRPGMTATLTITYRLPTPLGALRAEAWIARTEGIKTWAAGHLIGPDGVCAEAEGLFILPKWARTAIEAQKITPPPPRYFE